MTTKKRSCAIYGATNTYGKPEFEIKMKQLEKCIDDHIAEGFDTFYTAANEGYELNAARYICKLKQSNACIRLVVVRPYSGATMFWRIRPILDRVMRLADTVKYIADDEDDYFSDELDEWIVSNCDRIICVTKTNSSKLNRLSRIDLVGKEITYIPERNVPDGVNENENYPFNLLKEIEGVDSTNIALMDNTDAIEDALSQLLRKCLSEREQYIIYERYKAQRTLQYIGEQLNISKERVRQIESRALRKIKSKRYKEMLAETLFVLSNSSSISNSLNLNQSTQSNNVNDNQLGKLNMSDSIYQNAGSKWTTEEEVRLEHEFSSGKTVREIAELHRRNIGGINSRLRKMGLVDAQGNRVDGKLSSNSSASCDSNKNININEIVILAEQTPGNAYFNNYDELKEYLKVGLDIYNNTDYSLDNIEQARGDLLVLKTLKKKLTDKKKALLESYTLPIEVVVNQIDELIEMVKEPYSIIDRMLKANAKEVKRLDIMAYANKQAAYLGEFSQNVINSPSFFNPRWCNVSYRDSQWTRDVNDIISEARKDIDYILKNGGRHKSALLGFYFDKLSLDGAEEFLRTMDNNEECTIAEIVYVDSITGEIVEQEDYNEEELTNQDKEVETVIVKMSGPKDMIEKYLGIANRFGITIEK